MVRFLLALKGLDRCKTARVKRCPRARYLSASECRKPQSSTDTFACETGRHFRLRDREILPVEPRHAFRVALRIVVTLFERGQGAGVETGHDLTFVAMTWFKKLAPPDAGRRPALLREPIWHVASTFRRAPSRGRENARPR